MFYLQFMDGDKSNVRNPQPVAVFQLISEWLCIRQGQLIIPGRSTTPPMPLDQRNKLPECFGCALASIFGFSLPKNAKKYPCAHQYAISPPRVIRASVIGDSS